MIGIFPKSFGQALIIQIHKVGVIANRNRQTKRTQEHNLPVEVTMQQICYFFRYKTSLNILSFLFYLFHSF